MTTAPNTGSTLGGSVNKTSTSLSTHIVIKVRGVSVGAIQSMSINQQRPLKPIDELGTDGHIDMVPTGSTSVTGSCKRIRYDRMRIAHAFGRGYVHPQSQVYPFDIEVYDIQDMNATVRAGYSGSPTQSQVDSVVITTIKNVWIKSINTDYSASDWIIHDSMDWEAETIYTSFGGNGQSTTFTSGLTERQDYVGIPYDSYIQNIESTTDRGDYRGSMDAGGIIRINDKLF